MSPVERRCEEAVGTMVEEAPEDLKEEDQVILHLYLEEVAPQAAPDEPEEDPETQFKMEPELDKLTPHLPCQHPLPLSLGLHSGLEASPKKLFADQDITVHSIFY